MCVQAQPVGKSIFCDVACSYGQHGEHAIRVINFKPPTIELQKKLCRHQGGSFVTFDKCVVTRNAIAVSGCERCRIWGTVRGQIFWFGQS